MLTVVRALYVAMIVLCVALIFTHGFWFAVGMFLFLGVLMWLAMTVCDFFIDVGNALTRPSQHLHVYYERHPDPTGPDVDEHPDGTTPNGRQRPHI